MFVEKYDPDCFGSQIVIIPRTVVSRGWFLRLILFGAVSVRRHGVMWGCLPSKGKAEIRGKNRQGGL